MSTVPRPQLDKQRIAASFRASEHCYDDHAVVQKEVAAHLLNLLQEHGPTCYKSCLEVGCGTGILSKLFSRRFSTEVLYLNDLVDEFCQLCHDRLHPFPGRIEQLPGDIEQIDIVEKLDLILSSSTLQWVTNPGRVIAGLCGNLRQNGMLAISLFGPGTMQELNALTGDRGLKYKRPGEICQLLPDEMEILIAETAQHVLRFRRGREVLRHVRQTGVSGISSAQESVYRVRLKEFEQRYRELFGDPAGIPLTYVSIFLIAIRR